MTQHPVGMQAFGKPGTRFLEMINDLSHSACGGATLPPGPAIAVCFDASGLEGLRRLPLWQQQQLVLNLEEIELVRYSGQHAGSLAWISAEDPRRLAGPLLDLYEGAYLRCGGPELVCSGPRMLEVYPMPAAGNDGPEQILALLAAVWAARIRGVPEAGVRRWLAARAKAEPLPAAAGWQEGKAVQNHEGRLG